MVTWIDCPGSADENLERMSCKAAGCCGKGRELTGNRGIESQQGDCELIGLWGRMIFVVRIDRPRLPDRPRSEGQGNLLGTSLLKLCSLFADTYRSKRPKQKVTITIQGACG